MALTLAGLVRTHTCLWHQISCRTFAHLAGQGTQMAWRHSPEKKQKWKMKRKVFESLHYRGQINYFDDTFRWQTDKRKRRGKNKRVKEEQSYWWNTVKASQLLKSEETEGASSLLVFKIHSVMERHRYDRECRCFWQPGLCQPCQQALSYPLSFSLLC